MLDQVEIARILDILGNRNRRRIIDLLRQKPCFVTEISDRLMLSPKAVIEHLQIMEREEILSFRMDERRRKYYYLANDIDVMIRLLKREQLQTATRDESNRLRSALFQLRRMIELREELAEKLKNTEQAIDGQIRDITNLAQAALDNPLQTDILISLAHCDLTLDDLCELTEAPRDAVSDNLEILGKKHMIEQAGETFRLRDTHAGF
ncbi:MAG TPA: ArsR family transcriptional regulator [Methanolinea sp.]|mgnify:FL=1|jgi:ArsR family transcriptional regulator|nr:ArsR family transcriptional regulator [Methanolinea sp.]HPC54526.1 ArsR family transcriptional regulator [Methanolinea sp.]HQE84950.1 ArsR family transcriptional regulator [Methanolinea sp.]HQJ18211.1 ArsR family transcriptional regulator [Methanolinea sp.]HRS91915.1 ArsR family transcriptional regulator [Methanolinea sp.]